MKNIVIFIFISFFAMHCCKKNKMIVKTSLGVSLLLPNDSSFNKGDTLIMSQFIEYDNALSLELNPCIISFRKKELSGKISHKFQPHIVFEKDTAGYWWEGYGVIVSTK